MAFFRHFRQRLRTRRQSRKLDPARRGLLRRDDAAAGPLVVMPVKQPVQPLRVLTMAPASASSAPTTSSASADATAGSVPKQRESVAAERLTTDVVRVCVGYNLAARNAYINSRNFLTELERHVPEIKSRVARMIALQLEVDALPLRNDVDLVRWKACHLSMIAQLGHVQRLVLARATTCSEATALEPEPLLLVDAAPERSDFAVYLSYLHVSEATGIMLVVAGVTMCWGVCGLVLAVTLLKLLQKV